MTATERALTCYRAIIAAHPEYLEQYRGREIWIDPCTGDFEIGEGAPAVSRIVKRIGKQHARCLTNRPVGKSTNHRSLANGNVSRGRPKGDTA